MGKCSEKSREASSRRLKELWAKMTPEERSAYQKRIHPNQSAVTSRQMYERWAKCTGEARARRCAHLTNPEAQAKSHAAQRTPEFLAKRSAWAKAAYARQLARRLMQKSERRNLAFSCNGEKHTLAEWARIRGIDSWTIRERLKRGWPVEKALEPPQSVARLTLNGETHTQREWARIVGLTPAAICLRLKRGWPLEDILKPKYALYGRKPCVNRI